LLYYRYFKGLVLDTQGLCAFPLLCKRQAMLPR
jgi:hypothetical protein